MAYIGNQPADIGVYAVQAETGNGVLTAFTLDRAATTASILVSIDGVDQIPTTAYAVTVGTTLTFTSAPPNTSVISIRFLGDTVTFGEPSDNSVTNAKVADNALSGNKIDGGTISNFTSTGIDDNADAVAITIDSAEKVGVNQTTPTAKLHIKGDGASSVPFRIERSGGSGDDLILDCQGDNRPWLRMYQSGTEKIRFDVGSPSFISDKLQIGGTGAAAETLEVAGTVKITGGSPGASKVLTSDAAGVGSWTTPASGPMVFIVKSESSVDTTSIEFQSFQNAAYEFYKIYARVRFTNYGSDVRFQFMEGATATTSTYTSSRSEFVAASVYGSGAYSQAYMEGPSNADQDSIVMMDITLTFNSSATEHQGSAMSGQANYTRHNDTAANVIFGGVHGSATDFDGLKIYSSNYVFTHHMVYVYGVKNS